MWIAIYLFQKFLTLVSAKMILKPQCTRIVDILIHVMSIINIFIYRLLPWWTKWKSCVTLYYTLTFILH